MGRSGGTMRDDEHSKLCDVLRRCQVRAGTCTPMQHVHGGCLIRSRARRSGAACGGCCQIEGEGAALSLEEQSVLTKLQFQIREHLERRRRQQRGGGSGGGGGGGGSGGSGEAAAVGAEPAASGSAAAVAPGAIAGASVAGGPLETGMDTEHVETETPQPMYG